MKGHTLPGIKQVGGSGKVKDSPAPEGTFYDHGDDTSNMPGSESEEEYPIVTPTSHYQGGPLKKNRPERMVGRIEKAEAAGKTKKAARIKSNLGGAIAQWQQRQTSKAERQAKPFTGHRKGTEETLKRLENPKKWKTIHAAKQAAKGAIGLASLGAGISGLFGSPTFGGRWTPWKKGTKK